MKFTKCNLPTPLLALATENRQPKLNRYGVNELIDSPRIAQLKRRHWDELICDPLENLWMVFGKLFHAQMEARVGLNALAEEKMTMEIATAVGARTVAGVADEYENETVTDYKFQSVWSALRGVKPAYIAQLNIYGLLFVKAGFPVKRLQICAVYRDWSQTKADTDKEYPPRAEVLKVPVWPVDKTVQFVVDRINLHVDNETRPDHLLTECTDEERWASPEVFAVMKPGNKRAVKLHNDEIAANAHAIELGKGHFIEVRPREYRRCTNCLCRFHCNQVSAGKTPEQKIDEAFGIT